MEITQRIKEYSKELAAKMAKAFATVNVKDIKGGGTFKVIASTSSIDRDGESIAVEGWSFDNYMKNPILLFGHNYWDMHAIIGAVTNLTVEGKDVIAEGVFADTPEGQYIQKLYDDGILKTVSVGFIPLERNANVITKAELLEISFVPVPANPEALAMAKTIKALMDFEHKFLKTKEAVPFAECPMLDIATKWDAAIALENVEEYAEGEVEDEPAGAPEESPDEEDGENDPPIDFKKYAEGFAWFDSSTTEDTTSYKLLHHDVVDGVLNVVYEGVVAAMTDLLAKTGDAANIPDEEMQAVYDHLAAHYKQFEKEAPAMTSPLASDAGKAIKLSQSQIKKMKSDIFSIVDSYILEAAEPKTVKTGRVLSSKNENLIKTALDAVEAVVKPLQELLAAVSDQSETDNGKRMSQSDIKALTDLLKGADKLIEKAICNVKPLAKK